MSELTSRSAWRRVTFGDIVRQVRDRVDPEQSSLERYVAGEHMDSDDLRIRRWGRIGDGYLGPAFHARFKPGHVLYGSRRTYLRKVAVADFEGVTANTTFVLETKDPQVLLPDMLPFLMQTESFHSHSIDQSKGSVNPYVNFSDLAWYQVALPPLQEQRRIADILLASERTTQALHDLALSSSQVVKSLSAELLPEPGTAGILLSDVAQEDIERVRVEADQRYRIAGVLNAGKGLTDKGVLLGKNTTYSHLIRLRAGQLVLRKLTAWEGALAVVPEAFDGAFASTEFPTVSLDRQRLEPQYMARICQQRWFWRQMLARSKGTALRRSRLHQRGLLSIRINVPSRDEQRRIIATIEQAELGAVAAQQRRAESLSMQKALIDRLVQLGFTDSANGRRPAGHGLL